MSRARRRFTEEDGERLLEAARTCQGAPYLVTVAGKCKLPEASVAEWLRTGLMHADDGQDTPHSRFALEFRRIQADWMDKALHKIENANGKEDAQKARSLQWQLERLQRATFDLSRAPREAPPGDSNKPLHKRPGGVEALNAALANPDEKPLQ